MKKIKAFFIKRFKKRGSVICRLINDAYLRIRITLHASFVLNASFCLFQIFLAVNYSSVWSLTLAVYYGFLAFMRLSLLIYTKNNKTFGADKARELTLYRFCGVGLLLMNVALAVIVLYIVEKNQVSDYHGAVAVALAVYTVTYLSVAITQFIKYRKKGSPVLSAIKSITLAAALVSALSFESAVLSVLGDIHKTEFGRAIIALSGVAVCLTVLAVSINIIVISTKLLKNTKKDSIIKLK